MRVFLTIVLPLLLPTLLFLLWTIATHGRAPELRSAAWLWPVGGGLLLLLAALAVFGVGERADPDSVYVPARIEDGKLVPGHIDSGR